MLSRALVSPDSTEGSCSAASEASASAVRSFSTPRLARAVAAASEASNSSHSFPNEAP